MATPELFNRAPLRGRSGEEKVSQVGCVSFRVDPPFLYQKCNFRLGDTPMTARKYGEFRESRFYASILGRHLHMIDNDCVEGSLHRSQYQPKLLLHGSKDRWASSGVQRV